MSQGCLSVTLSRIPLQVAKFANFFFGLKSPNLELQDPVHGSEIRLGEGQRPASYGANKGDEFLQVILI